MAHRGDIVVSVSPCDLRHRELESRVPVAASGSIAAPASCSRGKRRRVASRAAALPTARSRDIRGRAAPRSDGASQSSRAISAKPTHSAMLPRYSGLRTSANGPAVDERAEAIAAGPRDRADVVHAPEPNRLATGHQRDPRRDQRNEPPSCHLTRISARTRGRESLCGGGTASRQRGHMAASR